MKKKLLSVIVPVYNAQEFLSQTLDSLEMQSVFADLDIILVNDGSTDDSPSLCEEFASKHDNVSVIHQTNQGVSSARNRGLAEADAEYVTFLDSDDLVESDFYEQEISLIQKNMVDMLVVNFQKIVLDGNTRKYRSPSYRRIWDDREEILLEFFRGRIGNQVTDKVFRTDLAKSVLFPKQYKVGEDMYFVYEVLKKIRRVMMDTDVCGYIYKLREDSAMMGSFSEKFFHPIEISEKMYEECKSQERLSAYSKAHLIHEICKVLEYALRSKDTYEYEHRLCLMRKQIKGYSIMNAYRYLSFRQFCGFLLMKTSPKMYLLAHRWMRIG